MRLAYLLSILTVLAVLVRPGVPGSETRSLAAETRPADAPREGPREEPRGAPDFRQWTDDAISSLENMRGDFGEMPPDQETSEPTPATVTAERSDAQADGQTNRRAVPAAGARETALAATAPPVFYRPSSPSSGTGSGGGSGPVCGDLGGFSEDSRIVFPLQREYFYSYEDTWGAARPQGGHEGTDLMTPTGVPEYAVTDGTVVPVAGSNADGWNSLGGYAVMVRADYSIGPVKRGDLFYYAHLERESPLPIGSRVRAGQVVGHAGDTGQGSPGTRGLFPPHLHLGWYDGTGGRSDVDSGAMNPYPLLEWIKSNGGAVTGGSDARYCEALAPQTPTPATGGNQWPDQDDPGVGPDLDTGSDDPRPSPVIESAVSKNAKKAGEDLREERDPAKKPIRPARPDKPPERDPDDAPPKPPDTDRPPETRKPSRPDPGPLEQDRPEPIRPAPDPPKPGPPAPGANLPAPPCDTGSSGSVSTGSQYDCAAGASPDSPVNSNEAGPSRPDPTSGSDKKTA